MKTTFILAEHFKVTPFEIMGREIDEVIMVVNHLLENRNEEERTQPDNKLTEKERDAAFWSCL